LQPLATFISSSHTKNPSNLEAAAAVRERDAQADALTGALLPAATAQGVYTRNQYEAAVALPGGPEIIITPRDGLDAFFTLDVPIIQLELWGQRAAAKTLSKAAAARRDFTQLTVEENVTRAYYELLGHEAALRSTKQGLEVAENLRRLVSTRVDVGIASNLDLQRAIAEVARREQELAVAEQNVAIARRELESLSRTTPEAATDADFVPDDLREEGPLSSWLKPNNDDLVSVRPSVLDTEAARQSRRAAQAAWLPTVGGQAQEHLTNATGFTGRSSIYTLSVAATWRLDFTLAPNVRERTAVLSGATAREDQARRDADDAIFNAWQQVRANIERARAARPQVEAATLALTLARDRYENGVATQLDVIQAQRDQLEAEIASIQAQANLRYARALLRLVSRRSTEQKP
jgi:outer membrane protein TolC